MLNAFISKKSHCLLQSSFGFCFTRQESECRASDAQRQTPTWSNIPWRIQRRRQTKTNTTVTGWHASISCEKEDDWVGKQAQKSEVGKETQYESWEEIHTERKKAKMNCSSGNWNEEATEMRKRQQKGETATLRWKLLLEATKRERMKTKVA